MSVQEATLQRLNLQVRERIDLFVAHVAICQGLLSGVVGSIRAKVKPVSPEGFHQVSLHTHELPSFQVSKNHFKGSHLIGLLKDDEYFVAVNVCDDSVGTPSTVWNGQDDVVRRWREAAQGFPRLSQRRQHGNEDKQVRHET
jgi:hypothetical protein